MDLSKSYVRAVLIYVANPQAGTVFLARNRKGPCKDLLNGFGGEIEIGERAVDGAHRELKEETELCVPLEYFQFRGKIEFVNIQKSGWRQRVDCYIYVVNIIHPFPIVRLNDSELYDCGKYHIDNLPTAHMTHGDHLWVKSVLGGRMIRHAVIERDADDGSIIFQNIEFEEC